ncbi:MAG: UDP-N-acetylmuramate--L-alanine ligase [Oligoflexales bacterium]
MTQHDPYYFVGIGGSGMAPLAEILLRQGQKVLGSDLNQNSRTQLLERLGATVYAEHNSERLPQKVTVVRSSAVQDSNPEIAFAKNHGLKILHRSDLLNTLMEKQTAITVAGTHGKTTTSAMVTWILEELDQDPSAVIGGIMCHSQQSSRCGQSNLFVAEADESDGSFLKYQPDIAVITNIDADHLDHYGSLAHIQAAFQEHAHRVKPKGWLIYNADDTNSKVLRQSSLQTKTFGFKKEADIWADQKTFDVHNGHMSIQLYTKDETALCSLPTVGLHNVQNALAALCVAQCLGLDFKKSCQALALFPGTQRRLNQILKTDKAFVFDDYAHNPGKITAVVDALKQAWPERHLHVIFQPHRYTRTESLWQEFSESFQSADSVCITPIYSAGEKPLPNITPANLTKAISEASETSVFEANSFDHIIKHTLKTAQKSQKPFLCLTVGAGDLTSICPKLSTTLKNELK